MKHPNATTSFVGGTGLGTLLVYGLRLAGVDLEPEASAAIATSLAAVILFIGRNGLLGVWRLLLRGSGRSTNR